MTPPAARLEFITDPTRPVTPVTYNIVITGEDKAGRRADTRLNIIFNTIPVVESVSAPNGFYTAGDSLPIAITFSEVVTVDTTGGTPQLELSTGNIDIEGTAGTGNAYYTSGSGTTELIFTYVQRSSIAYTEPDEDGLGVEAYIVPVTDEIRPLVYTGTGALSLNAGTIQSAAGVPVRLVLPAVGDTNSLSGTSQVALDNTAPVFDIDSAADNRFRANVGRSTTAEFYNANATDRGRAMPDDGITYALTGADAGDFEINADTGGLAPATSFDTVATYTLEITATDEVGKVATQYLSVAVVTVVRPTVIFTDNIEAGTPAARINDIANIADGTLTFTLRFSEPMSTSLIWLWTKSP